MKHVTFAVSQAPHGVGGKLLVPDEVAEKLRADGIVSAVEPWPAQAGAAAKPVRPMLSPSRPNGRPRDQRRAG